MEKQDRMCRRPEVLSTVGKGNTSLYGDIKNGLFPPPVKISERSSAWPSSEVRAINAARIAGKSNEEIKALVAAIVKQREQAMSVAT